MTEDCQKMTQATILIENRHKINGKFHDRGVWILDQGLVFGSGLKKTWNWIRIRFVLRGWIRIQSISDLKSVKDEMPREAKLSGLWQNISVDAAAGKQRQGGKLSVKQLEYNYNLCMGGLKVHTYLIVPKQFLPHNRYLILLILNKKDKIRWKKQQQSD